MPTFNLTETFLRTLKLEPGERTEYFDATMPGFGLRISHPTPKNPWGRQSWMIMYCFHGAQRRDTLGRYPGLPLKEAHVRAGETFESVDRGVDPRAKPPEPPPETFGAVAEAFVSVGIVSQTGRAYAPRYLEEVRRNLDDHVLPRWAMREAASITLRDAVALLETVRVGKPAKLPSAAATSDKTTRKIGGPIVQPPRGAPGEMSVHSGPGWGWSCWLWDAGQHGQRRQHHLRRGRTVAEQGGRPHARSVVQPQPAPFGLPGRHLEAFRLPDSPHPLVVVAASLGMQQGGNPPLAIAAILPGQPDHGLGQRCLVVSRPARLALRRTMLPQHTARRALGHAKPCDMLHGGPTTGSAQKLPDAASFRISFSNVKSDTARRKRLFFCSSCFRHAPGPASSRHTRHASGRTSPPSPRSP